MPVTNIELFIRLGVALAIGLLIGLERGSEERVQQTVVSRRITGMRTFGLIGVLGAVWALLASELGPVLLGFAFLGFIALMTVSHVITAKEDRDYGITTIVAALVTFTLGALAMRGHISITAAAAVVTTTLLGLKPLLHQVEQRLQRTELLATIKLLLLSVVVLPVLPNKGYGPWEALNPYIIWWMVVLIAGISYVGYFGIKIAGTKRGLFYTGLLGGLASSTAVTLNFSRLYRDNPGLVKLISAGILIAAGTMFPRMLLVAAVIHPDIALTMSIPLCLMALTCFVSALWLSRIDNQEIDTGQQPIRNPFELTMALKLGGLLAAIMLLAQALKVWMGDSGLFLLAAISGISDVDAINLTLTRMAANNELVITVATHAIILAALVNTFVKGILAAVIGGKQLLIYVGVTFVIAIFIGVVAMIGW